LDRLWSPWRSEYIAAGNTGDSSECVFCAIQRDSGNDEKNLILHRGRHNFVVLNLYPYISGHLLIVPFQHVSSLDVTPPETSNEMMDLAKRAQTALGQAYNPAGYNIGMNLGAAAGAGIVDHIHLHILPRWIGDSNFMSTVGQTRVLSEDLGNTYHKLLGKF
jgi:ATP adenylyltransferase